MRSLVSGMEQLSAAGGLMQVEAVTVASTRASSATLWLIDGDRLMRAAAPGAPAVVLPGDDRSTEAVTRVLGADRCHRIAHHDELLGFFAIRVPAGTHLTVADNALIEDVAAHAGLLLLNALLGVQLTRRVHELGELSAMLQTTRRRVVTAQDQERKRLERDLHDGAQQALVAAMIGLRTLRPGPGVGGDIEALTEVLDTAQTWLAGLTESDHPPVLVQSGLEGALRQAARAAEISGLHTRVAVTGTRIPTGRTDTDLVEHDRQFQAQEAVYFCCVEALQNAAKHARASQIDVTVAADGHGIHFEVVDDGIGIEPAQQLDGASGIPQLLQRLALCGGMLTVESGPGRGTKLSGVVPLGSYLELTG
jgi:signal transduction histidine kinase